MTDPNSSPRAVAEPAIDIGDLYVFPSPSRPGQLVLAMTVFPNARPGALFSDAASYRFSIRPVAFPAGGRGSRFEGGAGQYDVTCTFATAGTIGSTRDAVQQGTCALPDRGTGALRAYDPPSAHAG